MKDQLANMAKKAKYPTKVPTNGSPTTTTQRKARCNLCRLLEYMKKVITP
jgi:hypothetical protein